MEQPHNCPLDMYTIMRDCWEQDPDMRPTFAQLSERIGRILELHASKVMNDRDTEQTGQEPRPGLQVTLIIRPVQCFESTKCRDKWQNRTCSFRALLPNSDNQILFDAASIWRLPWCLFVALELEVYMTHAICCSVSVFSQCLKCDVLPRPWCLALSLALSQDLFIPSTFEQGEV